MSGLPKGVMMPPLNLRRQSVPLVLMASGWAVLGLTALGSLQPVRMAAVFVFALVAPGVALVRLLPLKSFLERAVLALALGLSLASLVAEGVAIGHLQQPALVLGVLAAICSAAAVTELAKGVKTAS